MGGDFFIRRYQPNKLSAIYLWHKIITSRGGLFPLWQKATAIIIFALSNFAAIFHDFDDKKRGEVEKNAFQYCIRFHLREKRGGPQVGRLLWITILVYNAAGTRNFVCYFCYFAACLIMGADFRH